MERRERVTLIREIQAIQIPDGIPIQLPEAMELVITQALGGTYTVMTPMGQMVRIDSRDADAIGKEDEAAQAQAQEAEDAAKPLSDRIWAKMKTCYDPEIPVNIVDLGLVYGVDLMEGPQGGNRAEIKMTLTAPGCGMGDILAQDVRRKVEELPDVEEADVEIVFDPQWSMDMMSEAARLELGLL